MSKLKVKAKLKKGLVNVKALAKHEMMTYNQAEKKLGDRNKANFITHISAKLKSNGETVFDMSTSQFLSKNPIFKFQFKGAEQGDTLVMTYTDRAGNTESGSGKIK